MNGETMAQPAASTTASPGGMQVNSRMEINKTVRIGIRNLDFYYGTNKAHRRFSPV